MSISRFFYFLIIGPLNLLFEFVFSIGNRYLENPGFAIIFLSLVMNIMVLPLYKRADALQAQTIEKTKKIDPLLKHINKSFKGDERFLLLRAAYREYDYLPTDVFKEMIPLLLQIPFFIAAYNMLSSLSVIQGVSFWFISDLGKADNLIRLGTISINILPILMTVTNIISSSIYTKGSSLRIKIQLYGIALLFLVILYPSPAGVVFYWTLNNIFSLVKNLYFKFFSKDGNSTNKKTINKELSSTKATNTSIVICILLFLSLFMGFLVPADDFATSTSDFVNKIYYTNPINYLWCPLTISFGIFSFWGGVFYLLLSPKSKNIFAKVSFMLVSVVFINYMAFAGGIPGLIREFRFTDGEMMEYQLGEIFFNILILVLGVVLFYILYKNAINLCKIIVVVLLVSTIGLSIYDVYKINNNYKNLEYISNQNELASFPLSTQGQNVVVIMMDRGLGYMVPFILEDDPELMRQLDGFTFYPNTISYGGHTNIAAPALYGGYEYTPFAIDSRSDESIADKHNEALLTMPVIFDNSGFNVTVLDPTYAGYQWIPDLSVFDEYPNINSYITDAHFNSEAFEMEEETVRILEHNVISFSFLRTAPLFMRNFIYNDGFYNNADGMYAYDYVQMRFDSFTAHGLDKLFLDSFSTLESMSDMTEITNSNQGTFLLMSNDTTHSPCLLDEETHYPMIDIDNSSMDLSRFHEYAPLFQENVTLMMHYQINSAALHSLGRWFDYLREQGVYDNTRIIIVSDHGRNLNFYGEIENSNNVCPEGFNPLLLVKDFDSEGFTVSNEFMTNADVPYLATLGVVENPTNPFTNNVITNENTDKSDGTVIVFGSDDFFISSNNGNVFNPGYCYAVRNNLFEEENWEYLGVQ